MISAPGIYPNLDENVYHSDPYQGGSISYSSAKHALITPRHYFEQATRPKTHSVNFDEGHIVHGQLLQVGLDHVIIDAENYRGKAAREERDQAYAEGKVPILADRYQELTDTVNRQLETNPLIKELLFSPGMSEVSMFGEHRPTGLNIRGRIDRVCHDYDGETVLVDVKTVQTADPKDFTRTASKYRYAMQAAWYLDMWNDLCGDEYPRANRFIHVLIEKEPGGYSSVCELTYDALQIGRTQRDTALIRIKNARENGVWPGWENAIHYTPLPVWDEIERDLLEEEMENH